MSNGHKSFLMSDLFSMFFLHYTRKRRFKSCHFVIQGKYIICDKKII
uniref:Uncharacterized protein n=1 Tax=Anguilla anguilla TaxID=7936 RepID=A0A0E9R490_ANGAN